VHKKYAKWKLLADFLKLPDLGVILILKRKFCKQKPQAILPGQSGSRVVTEKEFVNYHRI
jgi:hypothetical protein